MPQKYYAVRDGRTPGTIYTKWTDCESQVKGYSGAQFKSFSTPTEAAQFINNTGNSSNQGGSSSSKK